MTKKSPVRSRGYLITFEGIDGCGKSTQASRLETYFVSRETKVKLVREPGSTPTAEKIRQILLDKSSIVSPVSELLLYQAARADLVEREIVPALKSGEIVICDRFYDSTTAYQGYGRKLNLEMITLLNLFASSNLKPDLTFIFNVDLKTALSRRGRELDRLEAESKSFFGRVRKGFLKIAESDPRRVKVIDTTQPPDTVYEEVLAHVKRKLHLA
ncbi:MAG: dTMP kinase [candidate division Zixibacteria bacterium]|nr:dTMP kinase [candidate division Zixibacteria bacterium]